MPQRGCARDLWSNVKLARTRSKLMSKEGRCCGSRPEIRFPGHPMRSPDHFLGKIETAWIGTSRCSGRQDLAMTATEIRD